MGTAVRPYPWRGADSLRGTGSIYRDSHGYDLAVLPMPRERKSCADAESNARAGWIFEFNGISHNW